MTAHHHCFPSVPFQQFQVLFHSLFKVLFIFPSRYLFAIGLPSIFSFRWNLPPTLSCNPKQLDSKMVARRSGGRGCNPLRRALFGGSCIEPVYAFVQTTFWCQRGHRFAVELFPLQSPLLGESWLVSFPPLSYMLKFSGSSCLS